MKQSKKLVVASAPKVVGRRLRNIVFASMFAASAIPIGISSYLSYEKAKADLAKQADENLKSQGQAGADLLSGWIDSNLASLKFMAVSQDAASMDKDRGGDYVKKLQKTAPWFYAFFMIDPEGMQIAKSDDKLNNVADRIYFKQAIKGQAAYQISISKTTGKPAFLPAAPIYGAEKQVVGVMAGGADMDLIADKITGRKVGKTGFSYLVNDDNTILAHPDLKKIGKSADDGVKKLDPNGASSYYSPPAESAGSPQKTIKRSSAAVGNGLKLVTQIDAEEVEAPLEEIRMNSYKFLGLAVALSALFSFMLGSGISRGINKLAELSNKLSMAQDSDEIDRLSREISQVGGAREVKALGSSLVRLAQSIKLALSALG